MFTLIFLFYRFTKEHRNIPFRSSVSKVSLWWGFTCWSHGHEWSNECTHDKSHDSTDQAEWSISPPEKNSSKNSRQYWSTGIFTREGGHSTSCDDPLWSHANFSSWVYGLFKPLPAISSIPLTTRKGDNPSSYANRGMVICHNANTHILCS